MSKLREIEETPEHMAIVSGAEYAGIEPARFEAALRQYKLYIDQHEPQPSAARAVDEVIADIQMIRDTAGDLEHGVIGSRIRGNIGGVVTRACNRLEAFIRTPPSPLTAEELVKLIELTRPAFYDHDWRKVSFKDIATIIFAELENHCIITMRDEKGGAR